MMRLKPALGLLALAALLATGGFGYTKVMARVGSGTPPPFAEPTSQADQIVVYKADRRMQLLREGKVLRTYRVSLGSSGDGGHKQQEGDERTPEGRYLIDWRNPRSFAHLSLHISYPNAADSDAAQRANVSPGGNIMIHGLPNGMGLLGSLHHLTDWTDGCIAVTNTEMEEIWSLVPTGTPIEIFPGSQSL